MIKQENWERAEVYAHRAVVNIEKQMNLTKSVSIEKNVCTSSNPKQIAVFRQSMESLCLAYHHLANIKIKLRLTSRAYDYLKVAAKLADKFLSDKDVKSIIHADLAKLERKLMNEASQPINSNRSNRSRLNDLYDDHYLPRYPSDKKLINELINDVHKSFRPRKTLSTRASTFRTLPSPKNILLSPDIFMFKSPRSTVKRIPSLSPEPIPEQPEIARVFEITKISDIDIPTQLDLQIQVKKIDLTLERTRMKEIQNYSAVVIQKHVRGWITRSFLNRLREAPATPSEFTYIILESESESESLPSDISKILPLQTTQVQTLHIRSQTQPQASLNQFISKKVQDHSAEELYDILPEYALRHNFLKDTIPAHVRKRAKISDYLALKRPSINIQRRTHGIMYEWEMRVNNLRADETLVFDLELVGNTENSGNTLYTKIEMKYDPKIFQDYKVMHPFEFETIWPVAIIAVEKYENSVVGPDDESVINGNKNVILPPSSNLLDGKDEDTYDHISQDQARKCLQRILSKVSVKRSILGTSLFFSSEPSCISLESSYTEEEPLYLTYREGFISKLSVLQKHKIEYEVNRLRTLKDDTRELVLNNTIIEKGIIQCDTDFMFLSLYISTEFQTAAKMGFYIKTDYKSFARFELRGIKVNWKGELCVSWEKLNMFFSTIGESLYVPYLFHAERLPNNLRTSFYKYISFIITIENSTLKWNQSRLKQHINSPDSLMSLNSEPLLNLISTSTSSSKLKSFTDIDSSSPHPNSTTSPKPPINLALYIDPKEPLVHFPHISLQNFQEPLRLSLFLPNSFVLNLIATSVFSQIRYKTAITNSQAIESLVRICDQDISLSKCILESHLLGYKSIFGICLDSRFTKEGRRSVINDIIHFDGCLHIITISCDYKSLEYKIRLYNTSNSRILHLKISHIDTPFRNIAHSLQNADSMIQEWIYKAADLFSIYRGVQGRVLGIKNLFNKSNSKKGEERFSLNNLEKDAEIFRQKTVLEGKISALLQERDVKLMDGYAQISIITQRCKCVQGNLMYITVIRHGILEEWRIQVHIPKISKTFLCKVYDSDLWNISENALNILYSDPNHIVNTTTQDKKAWEIILNECRIELRSDNEMMFSFDNISIPLKELIYTQHFKKLNDLVYTEVSIKSDLNCMSAFLPLTNISQARESKLYIRAFLYEKRIWTKTSMTVEECILMLLKEGLLDESVLTNFLLPYSVLQIYSGALCRILKMKSLKTSKAFQSLPHLFELEEEDSLEIFQQPLSHRSPDLDASLVVEKDELLYSEVYSFFPPVIVGVYFNSNLDEFLFKIYKPDTGKMYRQPLAKKSILKEVPLSEEMLNEGHKNALGIRVLSRYITRVLNNLL